MPSTRPLVELVNEYLNADVKRHLAKAQAEWDSIHLPGAPEGLTAETAYANKVKAEADCDRLAHFGKMATELLEFSKLHRDAGIDAVAVFETKQELRDAVSKSCGFHVRVGDDCRINSISFDWNFSGGAESRELKFELQGLGPIECLPKKLHWLSDSIDHKGTPADDGFCCISNPVTYTMPSHGWENESRNKRNEMAVEYRLNKLPKACFVIETNEFYAVRPKAMPRAEIHLRQVVDEDRHPTGAIMGYYRRTEKSVAVVEDYDASALFSPYENLVRDDMSRILSGDSIRMDDDSLPPMLATLRDSIASKTAASIFRIPENRKMSPDEIYEQIGAYWDRLVSAPFDAEVHRDYARLKNLCRHSNADVHIWSEDILGTYGFKIRSREHDWVSGLIYCPAEALKPNDRTPLPLPKWNARHIETFLVERSFFGGEKFRNNHIGDVVSVGPCVFLIGNEKDH